MDNNGRALITNAHYDLGRAYYSGVGDEQNELRGAELAGCVQQ